MTQKAPPAKVKPTPVADAGVMVFEPMVITARPPQTTSKPNITPTAPIEANNATTQSLKNEQIKSVQNAAGNDVALAVAQGDGSKGLGNKEQKPTDDKTSKEENAKDKKEPAANEDKSAGEKPSPQTAKKTPAAGRSDKSADAGSAGADGPDMAKFRASAVNAAKAIPTRKIGGGGAANVNSVGGKAAGAQKDQAKKAGGDAKKAVSPAPKVKPPEPNPLAPVDPVPEATKTVQDAVDKRLPDVIVPGLEVSPVTQVLPSLTPPPAPTPSADDSKKSDAPKKDAKDDKHPAKDKADQVNAAANKPPEKTDKKSDADPVTLKDDGPKPEPPFPPVMKFALAPVLAELLSDPGGEAKTMLSDVRKTLYAGELDNQFKDYGDDDLLPALTSELEGELRGIATEAGLTEAEVKQAVEQHKQEIKAQTDAAKKEVDDAGKEQKKQVKDAGDETLGAIKGAKDALDEDAEKKLEEAKGANDPEVIRNKRERLLDGVNQKIASAVVNFDEAGKRRKTQLEKLIDLQKEAYKRRAKDDENKLVDEAKAAKKDEQAAKLTAAASFNWADAKGRELDTFLLRQKELVDPKVKEYQEGARTAGNTARQQIRDWADKKLGEHRNWLQQIVDMFTDWMKAARAESAAWEQQRNKATRDAVAGDFVALSMAITQAGDDIDVDKEGALDGLSDEHKAIFKAYFGKDSKTKGNTIAAVAAGLRVRIKKRRGGKLREQLEAKLDKEDPGKDNNCEKFQMLGRTENASFDGANVADEVYAALHGGVTGWNDEPRVFKALTGLSKTQAMSAKGFYKRDHGLDLEKDLKSELKSTFRTYDPEADRAVALLKGDPALADAATIYYALHGGMGFNDTDAVMKALRNKSPEAQEKIKKYYNEKYKLDLDDDLHGELKPLITNDTHDDEQAKALRQGDTSKADAIAADGALRGGVFGNGGVFSADHEKIEAIHQQIREDVTAELTAKAKAEQPARDVTTAEIEDEIARRNRRMESSYNAKYGADWKDKGEKGESALRVAYKDAFGNDPKENAKIALVNGLLDNDLAKADAAKIAIEHQSFWYASDSVQTEVLEKQYKRALEEKRRDMGPGLRQEMEKRRADDAKKGIIWDKYKLREEEKAIEKKLEDAAKVQSKVYMDGVRNTYDNTMSKFGAGSFDVNIRANMSGYDLDKAVLLKEQGGYLSPAQQIFFSTEGVGTSGDQFKNALKGKSPEEIKQIEKDLLEVRADQVARSEWKWKSPEEIKELKAKWIKEHSNDTLADLVDDETSGRLKHELNQALKGEPQNAKDEVERARDELAYEKDHQGILSGHQLDVLKKRMDRLEDKYKLVEEQDKLIQDAERNPNLSAEDKKKLLEERVRRLSEFGAVSGNVQSAVEHHKEQVNAVADAVVKTFTTIVAVAALIIVGIASAGTAVPAEVAAVAAFLGTAGGAATLAMGTAVIAVGIKAAILQGTYEGEDALKELGIGAVDALVSAATAGMGGKLLSSEFEILASRLAKNGWTEAEIAALKVMMAGEKSLQKPALGRLAAKGPISDLMVHGLVGGGENFAQGLPGVLMGVATDRSEGDMGKKLGSALKGHALQSAAMGFGAHAGTKMIGAAAGKVLPKKTNEPKLVDAGEVGTSKPGADEAGAVKPTEKVIVADEELPADQRGGAKTQKQIEDELSGAAAKKEQAAAEKKQDAPGQDPSQTKSASETDGDQTRPKPKADPKENAPKAAPDETTGNSMAGSAKEGEWVSLLHTPPEPQPTRVQKAWANTKKKYYQWAHDRWASKMLNGGMAAGKPPVVKNPGPPFAENHFTYKDGIRSPEKAYAAYNEALARANGREVGIYRNPETGEYAVTVGDHGSVKGPQGKGRGWETVMHYHPNAENVLVYRMPAPNDVQGTWNRVANMKPPQRPITEFVEFPMPDGSRGRTSWTVKPATKNSGAKLVVEYVNEKGEWVKQEYSHPLEFQKEWGSRTRFVDPDPQNPHYQDLRKDIDEWLAARRRQQGGFEEVDGVDFDEGSSMAKSAKGGASAADKAKIAQAESHLKSVQSDITEEKQLQNEFNAILEKITEGVKRGQPYDFNALSEHEQDVVSGVLDNVDPEKLPLRELRAMQHKDKYYPRDKPAIDLPSPLEQRLNRLYDMEARAIEALRDANIPLYDKLRAASPSQKARDDILKRARGSDEVSGQMPPSGLLDVDHVVPLNEIKDMPGFKDLDWRDQVFIINMKDNLRAVDMSLNRSRGDKSWNDPSWGRRGEYTRAALDAIIAEEAKIRGILQSEINRRRI